jgi:hypothetical protein
MDAGKILQRLILIAVLCVGAYASSEFFIEDSPKSMEGACTITRADLDMLKAQALNAQSSADSILSLQKDNRTVERVDEVRNRLSAFSGSIDEVLRNCEG